MQPKGKKAHMRARQSVYVYRYLCVYAREARKALRLSNTACLNEGRRPRVLKNSNYLISINQPPAPIRVGRLTTTQNSHKCKTPASDIIHKVYNDLKLHN